MGNSFHITSLKFGTAIRFQRKFEISLLNEQDHICQYTKDIHRGFKSNSMLVWSFSK